MRVIIQTSLVIGQSSYGPGDEVTIYDTDARRLIERGLAVPVRHVPVETATIEAPERAVKRRRKRKHVGQAGTDHAAGD